MNRPNSVVRQPWQPHRAPLGALAALLLGLLGCGHLQQARLQSEDDNEREPYGVRTIGDVCQVGNAVPLPLGGVGLVTGLEGTGGESPPDNYRAMLVKELQQRRVKNINELLASPNTAVVLVSAQIPPGARKGDAVDVQVSLPHGCKATSLRGGYLQECFLYNYDFARHLRPDYDGPQSMLLGHRLAQAEGPVLVGVGSSDGDEAGRLKQGRIWSGARVRVDQPFLLVMNDNEQFARMTGHVANRVNETFQGVTHGPAGETVAYTNNNLAVSLNVPAPYRLNLPRFLRVVRLIPLSAAPNAPAGPASGSGGRRSYRQQLAEHLLDPARTVTAALRLEALGEGSKAALKRGLESKHPLVRFCAAEALAYLGSPACGDELSRAVAEQPLFRAFALSALASLDEAISRVKLRDLLMAATDDETRYGAFRALRALDERNPAVRGELLNDSFWLHKAAPGTPPLVHISSTRRAEVVLFGEEPFLKPPFSFLAGEFTVTATEDDTTRCTVSRVPLRGAPTHRQCSLKLEDVLRTMTDLGGMYPEVITLLQQADTCQSLSCRVRCDALPQAVSVYDLVQAGQEKGAAADELVPAGQDLGATPTLYETGVPSHSGQVRDKEAALRDRKPRPNAKAPTETADAGE
jgi:hypothetical protein